MMKYEVSLHDKNRTCIDKFVWRTTRPEELYDFIDGRKRERGLPQCVARVKTLGLVDCYLPKDGPSLDTFVDIEGLSPEEIPALIEPAAFMFKGEGERKVSHICGP